MIAENKKSLSTPSECGLNDTYEIITASTPKWEEVYKIAQLDKSHQLWENYQTIKLNEYDRMIVTYRGENPIGFHGIFNNGRWPDNFSRFCNRAYITPYFRNLGHGLEITSRNIKFVLDRYLEWGKDVLFISRGVQYDNPDVSWRKFDKFCKYLIKSTGYQFTYDNRLYQCCPAKCKDCYQFCVWYNPKNINIDIHNISIDEWKLL